MDRQIHTLQEAATLLRMPYRTLRDAVYQGRWPHVRISARRRVMTDENITEVLTLLHQEPTPPPTTSEVRETRRNVRALLGAA